MIPDIKEVRKLTEERSRDNGRILLDPAFHQCAREIWEAAGQARDYVTCRSLRTEHARLYRDAGYTVIRGSGDIWHLSWLPEGCETLQPSKL